MSFWKNSLMDYRLCGKYQYQKSVFEKQFLENLGFLGWVADIHNCRIIQFFESNWNSLIYFLKNQRHILLAGGAMVLRIKEDTIYNGLINVKVIQW